MKRIEMTKSSRTLSIRKKCDLLKIARSTLYYETIDNEEDAATLMNEIQEKLEILQDRIYKFVKNLG